MKCFAMMAYHCIKRYTIVIIISNVWKQRRIELVTCARCGEQSNFMTIIDVTRMVEDFPTQGYARKICHKCARLIDDFFSFDEDSSITEWKNLD